MMAFLVLAAQLTAASPPSAPPQDWSDLRPLPFAKGFDDGPDVSAFVHAEVKAGRCAAATQGPQGDWTLKIDLAVLIGTAGQPRRVVPRAIACPSVEQYAAGLVSSMIRGTLAPQAAESWYRTSLTFSWPA